MVAEQPQPTFQQTEVGPIPSDWEVRSIGDFAIKVGSGKTPTGGERVYRTNGRPFVRSQNIGWGQLLLSDIAYIDEQTHSSFIGTEIQNNDVFLNITGASIGRSAISNNKLVGGNVNQHVCIIRLNQGLDNPGYLNHFLLSEKGQNQISDFQTGGNRQGLNFSQIKTILVPLPPTLAEQTAIANALSDADALITRLETLIAKKKAVKQGAMQELLRPKEGWEVKKLGEVVEKIVGGGTPARSNATFWNGSIPWITVKDFATFNPYSAQEYITKEGLRHSSSNLIPKGTLVTSTRMALGKAVIYAVDVAINQDLKAIFPKPTIDVKYLFYWFESRSELLADMGSGSTVMGISLADLKKLSFDTPELSEQTRIAQILSDMDAEIEKLEARLAKQRQLKQGMMQALLTGKIRLTP